MAILLDEVLCQFSELALNNRMEKCEQFEKISGFLCDLDINSSKEHQQSNSSYEIKLGEIKGKVDEFIETDKRYIEAFSRVYNFLAKKTAFPITGFTELFREIDTLPFYDILLGLYEQNYKATEMFRAEMLNYGVENRSTKKYNEVHTKFEKIIALFSGEEFKKTTALCKDDINTGNEWISFLLSACRLFWEIKYLDTIGHEINVFFEQGKRRNAYKYIKKEMNKNSIVSTRYASDLRIYEEYTSRDIINPDYSAYVKIFSAALSQDDKQTVNDFLEILKQCQ